MYGLDAQNAPKMVKLGIWAAPVLGAAGAAVKFFISSAIHNVSVITEHYKISYFNLKKYLPITSITNNSNSNQRT